MRPRLPDSLLAATVAIVVLAATVQAAPVVVRIAGVVTGEAGEPIEGVRVRVETWEEDTSMSAGGKTDKKGRYRVAIMHASLTYRFILEKEGYVTIDEILGGGLERRDLYAPFDKNFTLVKGRDPGRRVETAASMPYNKGLEAYKAGKWQEAREYFEKALRKDPKLLGAWVGLAEAALQSSDFADALLAADGALELDKQNLDALRIRVDALVALGETEKAEEARLALEQATSGEDG